MSELLDEVISKLSNALRRRFDDYKGLYLFGNCLTGDVKEDEDIEIVAIFDNEDKAKREKIWPLIGKIETDLNVCIDLYPYTMEAFQKDEDLYNEVMEEGIFYNPLGIRQNKGLG